jgi:cobyrinic acid a,c-diamide synthase
MAGPVNIPRLVIAGTHSGVGKTSVAVGLMAALREAGCTVQPFKVGPDYLDPGYHAVASGRPSWPLDSWMLGETGVRQSFARWIAGAQIAVIEGMMGLYDGASSSNDTGSTAAVARLLRAPVLLVFDAAGLARSVGALVLGYRDFDPQVNVAGVIANRVAGEGHLCGICAR